MSDIYPYSPMRHVPLDHNGIMSSAFSVQTDGENGWKEVGVVGKNYLLLPNQKVKDAAHQVAEECNIDFTPNKTFFNGKNYTYTMLSDKVVGDVGVGDDVGLGMQFHNSYDGSRAFGFSMMLFRLLCTNGMMTKTFFNSYRFKHDPSNEGWEENLKTAVNNINAVADGKGVEEVMNRLRKLNQLEVTREVLGDIRHNHLQNIPVGLWGSIIDRFTKPNSENGTTGWGLLNSATDLLWHKERPTVASYDQNTEIVDGLCKYAALN